MVKGYIKKIPMYDRNSHYYSMYIVNVHLADISANRHETYDKYVEIFQYTKIKAT